MCYFCMKDRKWKIQKQSYYNKEMVQKEELFIKGRYQSEDGLYRLTYSDAYGKRTSVYSKDKKMGVPDRMWAFFVNCVITWK